MAIVRDLARPDSILDKQLDWSFDPDKVFRLVSAGASTNANLIKALGAQVHVISGANVAVTPRYLKLYNLARVPVVGTDVPYLTVTLPASVGFALNYEGLKFDVGLAMALTNLPADNDTTALTAGDITGLAITYE